MDSDVENVRPDITNLGAIVYLVKLVTKRPGLWLVEIGESRANVQYNFQLFGLVSVLISFLQTIVILRGFQLNWPPEFYAVLGWLSAINFNIEFTAPECFLGDFISYSQKLRATLFLPIFFIAIAFLLSNLMLAIEWIRYKLLGSKEASPERTQKKNEVFKSFNAILLFLYASVATSALGHFDCLLDIDGKYYLDRDASLKCFDSAWNADLPFVISAIWVVAVRIMRFDEFYHPDRQFFVLINLLQKLALVAAGVYFTEYEFHCMLHLYLN
ncbi:hypothetical protein BKA69DRAFT_1040787 [Paraphysoderma sedebokerense]|nr:hypothetical protein BKA69DRAFT_1040774 [Paraphysoderma sedebokerense]KAI9138596.1 hypothetical protein BKA69DRAFT_1040787 [Paraphysoderma sedebokerense]